MSAKKLGNYLVLAARLFFSALLIFSAFAKLQSPESFLIFLAKLRLYDPFNHYILYGLSFAEMLLGFLCFLALSPKFTFAAIAALFAVFAIVLAVALVGSVSGPCGCFGNVITTDVGILAIARNTLLAAVALYLSRWKVHRLSLTEALQGLLAEK